MKIPVFGKRLNSIWIVFWRIGGLKKTKDPKQSSSEIVTVDDLCPMVTEEMIKVCPIVSEQTSKLAGILLRRTTKVSQKYRRRIIKTNPARLESIIEPHLEVLETTLSKFSQTVKENVNEPSLKMLDISSGK